MSEVPQGPGQSEMTGAIKDRRLPQRPGLYRDPESGKELEVTHPSGADALHRLGWRLVEKKAQASTQVSDPDGIEDEDDGDDGETNDVYKKTTLANGKVRYYKNGVPVAKAVYDAGSPAA